MSLLFRFSIGLTFLFFALLQYNDPDVYVWVFLYLSMSIVFLVKKPILKYLHFFLLSICSVLFIKNIDILIVSKEIQDELFYELGGIILILIASYFKFTDRE